MEGARFRSPSVVQTKYNPPMPMEMPIAVPGPSAMSASDRGDSPIASGRELLVVTEHLDPAAVVLLEGVLILGSHRSEPSVLQIDSSGTALLGEPHLDLGGAFPVGLSPGEQDSGGRLVHSNFPDHVLVPVGSSLIRTSTNVRLQHGVP